MGMDTENENIENIAESEEAVEAAENAEAASEQAGGEQQDEVKKIAEERDEFLKLAQRIQADFDNYRKRMKNAQAESYSQGVRDTVKCVLPVMDSLERALEAAPAGENPFFEGMQKIRDQFCAALTSLGVVEIEAKGKQFDPNLHNAVMHEECDMEPGCVTDVLQKGYKIGDHVIRYCMVKVSK